MSIIDALGPTQRCALLAALQTTEKKLIRSTGGWWVAIGADGKSTAFTLRTVRMLARAWLLDLCDDFATTAPLTAKGISVAQQLHDQAQSQAGVA